jgi:T4 RnlA family RNA ligase
MTSKAIETYHNLVNLCKEDEAFYFADFKAADRIYRIFNYRLANWTSFSKPSAKDCRGIMYDVTNKEFPILVSLPMEKFFNYQEGNVDHTSGYMSTKMVKMDGSLISTYLHKGKLMLKSKGSISSSQAIAAMAYLDKHPEHKQKIIEIVDDGFTVNMEWTAMDNRVVVPYQEERLTILSVRSHVSFWNYYGPDLNHVTSPILQDWIVDYTCETVPGNEMNKTISEIKKEQEGEGYVIEIVKPEGNYLIKVKNDRYLALHNAKDGIYNPKRLFVAVLEESTDDLRSMFTDDAYVLSLIEGMENTVQPVYNHLVKTVEEFYANNKHLERKEYAIKAQSEHPKIMGLLMSAYIGRNVDYKEFSIKNMVDYYGISTAEIPMEMVFE